MDGDIKRGWGRGRYGSRAVDENNRPLLAPQILLANPEPGTYTEDLRMARSPVRSFRGLMFAHFYLLYRFHIIGNAKSQMYRYPSIFL